MSNLFRIRNVNDVNRAVFRFVFKLDDMYSRFDKLSERRVGFGVDRRLTIEEIEKAALAATAHLGLVGECHVYVYDETLPENNEVLWASVDSFSDTPQFTSFYSFS